MSRTTKSGEMLNEAGAVFAFASWLTTLDRTLRVGRRCNIAPMALLAEAFVEANCLGEPNVGVVAWVAPEDPLPRVGRRAAK